ncbi:hypothetical protein EJ02DRAFT_455470 [Clathrospora elynae]|uniref:RING-type domain-containing protein n=1 Tax=Clathrospora elynae TaxID=706981 RepID=A0A6A5SK78_9PLEO|nr:hypothetical protein EJ02DRAFT_455470 [Clathrospora elynae]
MFDEPDNWIPQSSLAPASAPVYQRVRLRMRNLRGLRNFGQEHNNPQSVLSMTPEVIRKFNQQHLLGSPGSSRITTLTDDELEQEASQARPWLFGLFDCHERLLDREHQMRMFRLAVEKQMAGCSDHWSEMERLYMALTDYELGTPEERLRFGFLVVLQLNLSGQLQDVSKLATVRTDRIQRAATMDAELDELRAQIVEKGRSMKVDHFACAIPLSLLTATANNVSVIDDNAGCCPICQNSYTAVSDFSIEELLADFPVRIKHCGHVVGKACLEQWMATPKIEAAKYPHRTCPLCRIKIEGVTAPRVPDQLSQHLKSDRRAMDTVRELVYGWDVELEECLESIVTCMSEDIACRELRAVITSKKEGKVLDGRIAELRKEKWAWGFRGDGVWGRLRDEWMDSGVVRRE